MYMKIDRTATPNELALYQTGNLGYPCINEHLGKYLVASHVCTLNPIKKEVNGCQPKVNSKTHISSCFQTLHNESHQLDQGVNLCSLYTCNGLGIHSMQLGRLKASCPLQKGYCICQVLNISVQVVFPRILIKPIHCAFTSTWLFLSVQILTFGTE